MLRPMVCESDEVLLTVRQVAERLNCSVRTVQRLIACGRLPVIRLGPRLVRVDPARLDRWIDNSGRRPLRAS